MLITKKKHLTSVFEYGYQGCAKVEVTWDINSHLTYSMRQTV